MGMCIASLAMALMATKSATWLTIVRIHVSGGANALYVFSTALMLWSYARAMFTDAGVAPPSSSFAADNRVRAALDDHNDGGDHDSHDHSGLSPPEVEPGAGGGGSYCERCDAPKPPRVHHCSSCRRCVYRMDHHCPWTSNCVGATNKKYFLLFLFYTSMSCLTFNAMVSSILFAPQSDTTKRKVRHTHKSLLQFGWTLSLAIGGILACYFVFHLWLLHKGKTTLEWISQKPGEFEKYPFWFHVRVYFGRNPWLWWLPTTPQLDNRLRGRGRREKRRQEQQQLMMA